MAINDALFFSCVFQSDTTAANQLQPHLQRRCWLAVGIPRTKPVLGSHFQSGKDQNLSKLNERIVDIGGENCFASLPSRLVVG